MLISCPLIIKSESESKLKQLSVVLVQVHVALRLRLHRTKLNQGDDRYSWHDVHDRQIP